MARWKELGLSLGLLGMGTLGASGYARAQEQQVSVEAEKSTGESGAATRAGAKSSILVEPLRRSLDRDNRVGLPLLKNIAEDQKAIWIGPKHLRFGDADWLVPLVGATAA